MWFNKNTHANVKHWAEYRTESGRWSRVRHGIEELNFDAAQLRRFFSTQLQRERREYAYFEQGYLPCRVTTVSPALDMRYVYVFNYRTED